MTMGVLAKQPTSTLLLHTRDTEYRALPRAGEGPPQPVDDFLHAFLCVGQSAFWQSAEQ